MDAKIILVSVFAGVIAGCTPAQGAVVESQLPSDILQDVECVAGDLLQGTQPTLAEILSQCGSLTLAQGLALVQSLLAAPAGATSVKVQGSVVRVPAIQLTDAQRTRLQTFVTQATQVSAAGAK